MKTVLIISPYFPPVNAADMQRVRMSLPYFAKFGWIAEVVTVDNTYTDIAKDELLLESLPTGLAIHTVKAFSKKTTSKIGLGSLALRSLLFYKQKVDKLLNARTFDLVYFSTTQFPVCILGPYWKKRFGVPFVIDMQDPWHSDYYQDKPKPQRPPKYWFSYRSNKYLERSTMRSVDGLISVSENYVVDLKQRYERVRNIPCKTITFGSFAPDLVTAKRHEQGMPNLLDPLFTNIVYIGRGGMDMHRTLGLLFNALKHCIDSDANLYAKLRLNFIGTSYAPNGSGTPTIAPLAKQYGIDDHVIEITDRISYFQALATLQKSDALLIAGSDDPNYTASKIYPYLLINKPLLAIFHPRSPALPILADSGVTHAYSYDHKFEPEIIKFLRSAVNGTLVEPVYNKTYLQQYSAENMTKQQCDLFESVLSNRK